VALTLEQQQQQLYKINAELANLKKEQSFLKGKTQGGLLKKFDPNLPANKTILSQLADKTNQVNAKQAEYDNLKKILDAAKAEAKVVSEAGSAEEARKAALAGYGPNQIEEYRADLAKQLADEKAQKQAQDKGATNQQSVSDYGQLLNTIAADETELKSIQEDLKKNFSKLYKGEVSGLKDWIRTQVALEAIAEQRGELPKSLQGASLREFLLNPTIDITAGAKGAGGPQLKITISSPTEAASTIQSVFKNTLNRDATLEEIAKFTTVLNKAERNAGRKTKTSGGRTEYTTDLDRIQFLTEEVKKIKDPKTGKSEFETKRGEKESLTSQNLVSVASLNGIDLSPDQLNSYLTDIRNGKDINVIKNQIRSIAGLGMPDNVKKLLNEGINLETIYAPYKKLMASTLELNPESINLKDPTLRLAFGPDKETTIYDFEKALRKDYRWQYTNNAKRDVSNIALKVLQDFGFQA
jgi:hypothetical protein